MQDQPEARELLQAIKSFLDDEIISAVGDPRLKFRARIASNVLSILTRELELENVFRLRELERLLALFPGAGAGAEPAPEAVKRLNAILVESIRAGKLDVSPGSEAWEHVWQTTVEKLLISNPAFVERISREASAT